MKFEGKFEITPKEIADLVRELQSQPKGSINNTIISNNPAISNDREQD
ncbi:hypothetical protein [Anaerotignum sp. MB30-C6]|nr:hypothetical protein [Anaerotignum sp. MB30-C6]WMI80946.1 hypothetical protein RBQ60_14165 [Anaerotignum sp. MB30-C6]